MESNNTIFRDVNITILPRKLLWSTINLKLGRNYEIGFRTQGSGTLLEFFKDEGRVFGPE